MSMLVMRAPVDVNPRVMKDGGDFEQQSVAFGKPVLRPQLIEQTARELRDEMAVRGIETELLAERRRAREDLASQLLRWRSAATDRLEEQPHSERGVGDGQLLGTCDLEQIAIDEQCGYERLGGVGWKTESLRQIVDIECSHIVAERDELRLLHRAEMRAIARIARDP